MNDTPKHNDLRPLAQNSLNDRVTQGVFAAFGLDGPPRHTKITDLAAQGLIQRALCPPKGSILQGSILGDLGCPGLHLPVKGSIQGALGPP